MFNAESARRRNLVGRRIASARRARRLTQGQLAAALAAYGVRVQAAAISKWEKGESVPGAYQLFALEHALDIAGWPDLAASPAGPPEGENLNEEGLSMLHGFRSWLESQPQYRQPSRRPAALVEMPVSLIPASAGFGEVLDNNAFEKMSFPAASVPAGAAFAVRVNGDSMEPVLHDGQYAWVQECTRLNAGEVGLFIVDGDGYIKVYNEQDPAPEERDAFTDSVGVLHPQPVLISCNKEYAPKVIPAESEFCIVGRVLNI